MTIEVGDRVPSATFHVMTDDGPEAVASDEFFAGRKVALFALPGAFTPTCSAKHVPGFKARAAELRAKGVEAIACLSVNDAFVMGAWGKDQGVGADIVMLADGSAEFTDKAGLALDLSARGFGIRSRRYSMLVDDGAVSILNVEADGAFEVSDADTLLAQL